MRFPGKVIYLFNNKQSHFNDPCIHWIFLRPEMWFIIQQQTHFLSLNNETKCTIDEILFIFKHEFYLQLPSDNPISPLCVSIIISCDSFPLYSFVEAMVSDSIKMKMKMTCLNHCASFSFFTSAIYSRF